MFAETDKISLRKTILEDLDFVCELESDQENKPFINTWTKEVHEEFLSINDVLHVIIEEKETNKKVGYIILSGINNPNNSIELVRITVADKGMGYGKEAFHLIKNWIFNSNDANRLWLEVNVTNFRAISLYGKQGFTIEGTLRECKKKGEKYESLHVMSILRREFLEYESR